MVAVVVKHFKSGWRRREENLEDVGIPTYIRLIKLLVVCNLYTA